MPIRHQAETDTVSRMSSAAFLTRRPTMIAALMLLCVLAAPATAQDTREVTVGPQYQAGHFHRLWLGDGYRDLWATPVRLPVLDLAKEAGGLTPVRQVGQAQSVGLAMRGADGRAYTFRSLHKESDRMLAPQLRRGVVGAIARDLNAGTHPAAGVILPVLAEAAGVPHTSPRLVVMPDDPALGQFRATFANLVGTIEEFPLPAGDGNPGFMGATEILTSPVMWTKWIEGPQNSVDRLAYLRARGLDLWVDNYDRHRGQWRWMKLPGQSLWQPLPEDPDFVLVHRDGLVPSSIRKQVPQYLNFSAGYPQRLDGALLNSAEMDRWILSSLTAADFEAVARDLQGRFTDEVIDRALRQMPAAWYAINGKETAAMLRSRRAGLADYLLRVYRYYAAVVDVHTSNRDERVRIERAADNSVDVSVSLTDSGAAPFFHRRFTPDETREIRIFVHDGNDRVERTGAAGGPIAVRVVTGGGHDVVDDSRSGGTDVWRDSGDVEVARGAGTHVRLEPWQNPEPVKDAPWIEPRSYGRWTIPTPIFGYAPDVALYLGYGFTRTSWGFRTLPAKSIQTLHGAGATGDMAGKLEYIGTFYRPASRVGFRLQAFGSGIESYNFFGFGNESPVVTDRAQYKTRESVFQLASTVRYAAGRRLEMFGGAEVRYSDTPTHAGTIVAQQLPLGAGHFGRVSVIGGLTYDSRGHSVIAPKADYTQTSMAADSAAPTTGWRLETSTFFGPGSWDVPSNYGGFNGQLTAYFGNPRAHVALRAGGRQLFGDYPWFDAAAVGGANNRGFSDHRFTGDASLFGSLSVRTWLTEVSSPVLALRFGLVGFTDTGRVWLEEEDSQVWHSSFGGGVLVQPAGATFTLHAIAARSKEGTRLYVGMGYPF